MTFDHLAWKTSIWTFCVFIDRLNEYRLPIRSNENRGVSNSISFLFFLKQFLCNWNSHSNSPRRLRDFCDFTFGCQPLSPAAHNDAEIRVQKHHISNRYQHGSMTLNFVFFGRRSRHSIHIYSWWMRSTSAHLLIWRKWKRWEMTKAKYINWQSFVWCDERQRRYEDECLASRDIEPPLETRTIPIETSMNGKTFWNWIRTAIDNCAVWSLFQTGQKWDADRMPFIETKVEL